MAEKNLSFILEKQNSVKFEDRPVPNIQSPDDVIVNVRWTGICGSDIHFWVHGGIGDLIVKEPMVLGHESAGVITAVGDKVSTLKVGDRVCMEPGISCRTCMRCKEGRYNLCPDMRFAATPPIDGTLAKYYRLPEDLCYKLPDNMSLEEGALIEPMSGALHAVRQAGVSPGESVLIFGAGPMGLLSAAVSRAHGASKIVLVDINEERLAFAKKYAATHTVTSQKESAEDAAKRIVDSCDLGFGADCAIDASGADICIQTALHAARGGGTFVQLGMGKADINFPIMTSVIKELTMKGSFRYGPGDYALAVELVASGKVDVKPLITGRVSFRDAEKAFHEVKASKGIKTLIEGVADDGVQVNGNSH